MRILQVQYSSHFWLAWSLYYQRIICQGAKVTFFTRVLYSASTSELTRHNA